MDAAGAAGGNELDNFFRVRIDKDLIERLYGAKTCKVLDVQRLCSQYGRQGIAFWFVEQLLINVFCRVLDIVKAEIALNGSGRSPQSVARSRRLSDNDERASEPREILSKYLRQVPIDPVFQSVELDDFPWFNREAPADAATKAAQPPALQSATIVTRPCPSTVTQWSSV